MTDETKDRFKLLANSKYNLWLRDWRDQKLAEIRKHGEVLYSRFAKRYMLNSTCNHNALLYCYNFVVESTINMQLWGNIA